MTFRCPRPQGRAAECPQPQGVYPQLAALASMSPATTWGPGAEPPTARYWAAITRSSSPRSKVKMCQSWKASRTETKPRSKCRWGARQGRRKRRKWREGGGMWGPRVWSGRNTRQTRTKRFFLNLKSCNILIRAYIKFSILYYIGTCNPPIVEMFDRWLCKFIDLARHTCNHLYLKFLTDDYVNLLT